MSTGQFMTASRLWYRLRCRLWSSRTHPQYLRLSVAVRYLSGRTPYDELFRHSGKWHYVLFIKIMDFLPEPRC
eukprot:UN04648